MNPFHHHQNCPQPDAEGIAGEQPRRPERRGPRRGGPHGRRRGGFGPSGFGPFDGAGFGPGMGPRRGPGRGRRGDVRNAVLALLREEPMNGYQLISAIAERTDGLWRPSPGSIYPALGLLQDEGLIEPAAGDSGKAFQLTAAGRTHVEAHADELTNPWQRVARPHEGYLDVRQEVGQLAMAVKQVVMTGDQTQIAAAREVLDQARRSIYRVLAGDAPTSTDSEASAE